MNIDKKEKLKEDMIVKKYHYRFYQTGNDEDIGIVPRLLRELLAWRKEVKNLMKTAKGNYKKLLDARQLAIKVTCNSVYGFFGTSGNGMRSCLEVARSVTARAREYIHRSFDYLVNTYQATILAADTDSAMFTIPYIKERSECNKWGELLAIEMSYGVKKGDIGPFGVAYQEDRPAIFPKGIEFTHEKDMVVCYLCKKHYLAWFIKPDGTIKKAKDGSNELLAKGIPLVRRDTTPIVAELYSKLVEIILSGGSILQALAVTMQHMCDIYQNKFDYTHFTTITKLGENYKNPNHPMELFRKFLHSVGKSAKPGDRLEYIIVVNPYATHKGHKMVLAEQYLDSLKTANSYQIDYDHYIEKSLNNPINQLFKYGFIKEMSFLRPYIQYKIGRWVNTRSLDDIIEILLAARTHNLSYNDIYHHVHIIHVQIFPK
jgi:DNA polymerase elongation subunit (family B)